MKKYDLNRIQLSEPVREHWKALYEETVSRALKANRRLTVRDIPRPEVFIFGDGTAEVAMFIIFEGTDLASCRVPLQKNDYKLTYKMDRWKR